jgi:hypothetical protein
MAPRENWTDERLDDLKTHVDEGFREVRADLRQQQGEMARQKEVDARFDQLNRTMQIGFGIIGSILAIITAMLAGALGLIATQL